MDLLSQLSIQVLGASCLQLLQSIRIASDWKPKARHENELLAFCRIANSKVTFLQYVKMFSIPTE